MTPDDCPIDWDAETDNVLKGAIDSCSPPLDRGCRWCQALPGEWCENDCGSPSVAMHPDYREAE